MNDELTPDERAALRARIVGGAHDITPVGAHRNAWIAGSLAAVLVVAIAGGVAATTTLSAPEIATTPTITSTPQPTTVTPQPTPAQSHTPSATSTPMEPVLAFGGDCSAVLTESMVSSLTGVDMRLSLGLPVADEALLGGLSCQWRATDADAWQALNVSVLPWEVVPDEVRARVGDVPVCDGGGPCEYSERFGDAWVVANADVSAHAVSAVGEVGPRAAVSAGAALSLPPTAWSLADRDAQVLGAVEEALGRDDLGWSGTDNVPQGQLWDVLSLHGVAAWFSLGPATTATDSFASLWINVGAGTRTDVAAVEKMGGTPIAVAGAEAAWWLPGSEADEGRVRADAAGGVIDVHARGLTEEQLRSVAAALIASLG